MKFLPRLSSLLFIAGICSVPLTAQPIRAEAEFSGEILTRGPVHEAFAAVVSYNPEAGFIVDRAPPELIEELPSEERPVDADTAWIPGYWAWDDERGDFIWISGTWRVLPPGRAWIAGYWRDTGRGWQWVTGYWEDAGRREVVYLAPPPETLERGPSSPQPTPNHEWVSGHWEWMDGRYFWRAGYWIEGRTDWVWVPSYYVWTPRGHVFVEGYWDYAPVERGLLFAPVYYADYRPARSYYRPSIVLNVAILSDYLFLRPRYSHYYFGDYYDPRYESSGFYATFEYHTSRRGYDPFYTYSRWRHRDDRDWERNYRSAYEYRRSHEEARPPRRWTGTNLTVNVNQNITNITQVGGTSSRQTVTYAQPVQQYAQIADAPLRVERVATANVQQQAQVARQVQEQRAQRRTLESQQVATSASAQSGSGPTSSDRQIGGLRQERSVSAQSVAPVAMPASPIVARDGPGGRQPPPRAQGNRRDDDRQARQAGQEPARGRESAAPVEQRQPGQQSVIGSMPEPARRNEPPRRADRGLRADNSAAVEAQRLEEQAREQERRQAEEARRGPAVSGQIGANPRPDLPEQAAPRAMERRDEAWQQTEDRRRAAEAQERAYGQQQQAERDRREQGRYEEQQRREQERQQQQQARQQETDARQQQREAEFQAREQQGRAAEAQAREQQSRAADQSRQQQAQAEQQRAQQAQAAEQQRGQQAREQQRAAEQQAREPQRASDQQAREQQRAAEQQAREQQRAAEQGRQAQPDPRATPPGRGQNQPQPKAAPSKGQSDEEKRKQAEADEEERKKGRRG